MLYWGSNGIFVAIMALDRLVIWLRADFHFVWAHLYLFVCPVTWSNYMGTSSAQIGDRIGVLVQNRGAELHF